MFEWTLLLSDMQRVIRSFCADTTAEILLGLTCQRELAIFLDNKTRKEELAKSETKAILLSKRTENYAERRQQLVHQANKTAVAESNPHILDLAIKEGHLRFVKWSLAGYEARGEYPFAERRPVYFEAIKGGHLDLLKWLVKKGHYHPLRSEIGADYLGMFWASYSGQSSILDYIGKLMGYSSPDGALFQTRFLIHGAVLYERLNALSWLQVRGLLPADVSRLFAPNEKIPLASQQWLFERGRWHDRKDEDERELNLRIIPGGIVTVRNYAQ